MNDKRILNNSSKFKQKHNYFKYKFIGEAWSYIFISIIYMFVISKLIKWMNRLKSFAENLKQA